MVFGLVIMKTAVRSSSLALRSAKSTSPLAVLLIETVLKAGNGGAGGIGAVGAVGDEHARALLPAIAKIGRRHQAEP